MIANAPLLENWYISKHHDMGSSVLVGEIHDDPRWDDGTVVHTSTVIDIDSDMPPTWALTRNHHYRLGAVRQEWLDWARKENGWSLQSYINPILKRKEQQGKGGP